MNDLSLDLLKRLNLAIRRDCELAEARVESANVLLAQLAATGLTRDLVFLGKIVLRRAHEVAWGDSTGQVIQASLSTRAGFGAIYWDSEQLAALADTPELEVEALGQHVPFNQCEPAVKALLLPQLVPMLDKLIRAIGRV